MADRTFQKDDRVLVLAGFAAGRRGKVLAVRPFLRRELPTEILVRGGDARDMPPCIDVQLDHPLTGEPETKEVEGRAGRKKVPRTYPFVAEQLKPEAG